MIGITYGAAAMSYHRTVLRLRNPLIQSALRAVVNRKSVGSDAIRLSCFLAAASKISRFCPFRRVPAFAASGRSRPFRRISFFDRTRCAGLRSNFVFSRTSAQRPSFGLPTSTRPAVPGKSDTAATRGSRWWTGGFLLRLLERFQPL